MLWEQHLGGGPALWFFIAVHIDVLWATAWPIAVMSTLDHAASDCTQATLPSADALTY